MPQIPMFNMAGKKISDIDASDAVFGIKPNKTVMHLAVVNYLANQRQGTQSTKTRAEVSGGGKKPWRQKGTGHARQGSTRAPQWTHGGIALGPKPRDYHFTLNKKVRQLAIRSALSDKAQDHSLLALEAMEIEEYHTKTIVNMLEAIGTGKKTLIVLAENDPHAIASARNIPGVKTVQAGMVCAYDIINADTLLVVSSALPKLEEVYA